MPTDAPTPLTARGSRPDDEVANRSVPPAAAGLAAAAPPGAAARAPLSVELGRWFFRVRNAVFPLVLLAVLGGLRPARGPDGALGDWLDLAGLAVALAGQSLRVAVIGYAYIRRGGKDGQVYAGRLVTEGFFAHCRNPLYLGNLLVLLGLFMIHGNPWVHVLGGGFFVAAYSAIVAAEEDYLRRRFGTQYAEYCRRVRRWMPDVRALGRSIGGMRFDWRRVIVKEYGSAYAWMAGAVLLLVYQRAPGLTRADVTRAAIALALLTAGWGAARYYKKRGPRPRPLTQASTPPPDPGAT
jgi:protein-S-isoprenylcysteine O-methyltransferase Ste14